MRFLVTNDDGIYAEGIRVLIETLSELGEVYIAAPNQERSGVGHAITVNRPLRIEKLSIFPGIKEAYMMDGTPADCVKLAIEAMELEVDFVVSGINNGANLGTDVFYSGTVAAAFEGALQSIPSIALSLCKKSAVDQGLYQTAAQCLQEVLAKIQAAEIKGLLNINVPNISYEQIKGFKTTKLGVGRYKNEFEKRLDPRGKPYYWMKGIKYEPDNPEEDDYRAVEHGFVSITPLQVDMTNYEQLKSLKAIFS
ncbi:MAG TPA: 5'/3'-nucleotidase SurE [Firmicutes bacterium]|nr:5'/3'-nucleotidase SurE [Bacillota bacterium]